VLGTKESDRAQFNRELASSLLELQDPSDRARVIRRVCQREEIYDGPYQGRGPDLVAIPLPGYDLKGNFTASQLAAESEMKGMHTDDDAFLYIRNYHFKRESAKITDLYPTILSLLDISPEKDVDGISLIS
jgi:predicted AlkP superfamily phosphohydrolase/phosphomutase